MAKSYEFTSLSDGTYSIDIMAIDKALNTAIISSSIIVDTTPPEIISNTVSQDKAPVDIIIRIGFSEPMDESKFEFSFSGSKYYDYLG